MKTKAFKIKTFKEISLQCERIFNLHVCGFGTDRMFEMCEQIYFRLLAKNGY